MRFGAGDLTSAVQGGGDTHLNSFTVDLDDDLTRRLGIGRLAQRPGVWLDLVVELGFDPVGKDAEAAVGGSESRVVNHRLVKGNDRRHAVDDDFVEGAGSSSQGLLTAITSDDELADEGVEGTRHRHAGMVSLVHADARAVRWLPRGEGSGSWHEPHSGVLSVDAELEGVTAQLWVLGRQVTALGDMEHHLHQVDSGHFFRNRVLYLQPGIDLEEADCSVLTDEEFAGCGADIFGLLEDGAGGLVETGQLLVTEERCRGLLDELLVTTLQGAVAGRDDLHGTVVVGDALGLDVTRLVQVALDETFPTSERGDGFTNS